MTHDRSDLEAALAPVEDAITALRRGQMIVVVDSPDRENEGDLVVAADHITPEAVNFMATYGRGLICVAMAPVRLRALAIPPMVEHPTDPKGTAFHVGVDCRRRTTTGISARDRALTIRALSDEASVAGDFTQPGHVFPLAARSGGVLERAGHTEASVDMALLAGLTAAAAICEIAGADGEMARLPQLIEFAEEHGLLIVSISDLIAYRQTRKPGIERVSDAILPLAGAEWRAIAYRDLTNGLEHLALVLGEIEDDGVLVRVHSECLTGDVFGSRRCDCGEQLELAIEMITAAGSGVVVYLRGHEGRGIGLANKIHAYRLQDSGLDTVEANVALGHPADRRDYGTGMRILVDLGVERIRLLTNNPEKRAGLEGFGLEVVDRVPLVTDPLPENLRYLQTKRTRLGHLLPNVQTALDSHV